MRALTVLIFILILASASVFSQSFDVDHIDGTWSDGIHTYFQPDETIVYHLRYDVGGRHVKGCTNGLRIYSEDGALWTPPVMTQVYNMDMFFTLVNDIFYFSVDGQGEDTLAIGLSMMLCCTPPPNFNEIVYEIETSISSTESGKNLCIDSTYFPPSGLWLWAFSDATAGAPYWGGPYCYEIKDCCTDRGDVDGDGYVCSISDLLYLGTYMFSEGPEPSCLTQTDVNGSGGIPDITDLVYMVTYMFLGGPPPVPCPE